MDSVIKLIRNTLAVYRLAGLISLDDGPYHVFAIIRERAENRARLEQAQLGGSMGLWQNISELVECPYCTGVWVAAFVLALSLLDNPLINLFLDWIALAGGQTFLETIGEAHGNDAG